VNRVAELGRSTGVGCSAWLGVIWWIIFTAWIVVFILWLRALVAYIMCDLENQKTQRECRQYISEMRNLDRMRLQAQARLICNLGDANLKDGSGKLEKLVTSVNTIQKPQEVSWSARLIKKPFSFLLRVWPMSHLFGRFHKRATMTPNVRS
jgi:hypothetical protein